MKRLKNSVKVIIGLICVLVVAVSTIVTVIVLTNKRKKEEGDSPETAYVLTAQQKILAADINNTTSHSVSSQKMNVYEFDTDKYSALEVDRINYFDDSVYWYNDGTFGGISAYMPIYENEGEAAEGYVSYSLVSKIKELPEFEPFESGEIILLNAGSNHFRVKCNAGENYAFAYITVKNHDIVINKMYNNLTFNSEESLYYQSGKKMSFFFDEKFFVVYVEESTTNKYYEFFEYKDSYANYTPYKYILRPSDEGKAAVLEYSIFSLDGVPVVQYSSNAGFELCDNAVKTNVNVSGYGNVKLIQTRTEVASNVARSELVGDKYYTYSYKLSINGVEKDFELGDFDKIQLRSTWDNHFALYLQKVNSAHSLETAGQMMYFDLELNKIASYGAKSASSVILYSKDEMFLTSEGLFSTKNEVNCSKVYDFDNLGLTFVEVLTSGSFVMKDSQDFLYVYNFEIKKAIPNVFEKIEARVDDNSIIFMKSMTSGNEYFIYYFSTNTVSKINYKPSDLSENTKYFFTKAADDTLNLCTSSAVVKTKITSFDLNNSSLNISINGTDNLSYYFSSKVIGQGSVEGYSCSAAGTSQSYFCKSSIMPYATVSEAENLTGGGSSSTEGGGDPTPSPTPPQTLASDLEILDKVYYNYDDVVVYDEDNANNIVTITASHCLKNGIYSNENYKFYDYLQLNYSGSQGTNYKPLRVHYYVSIDESGKPKIETLFGRAYILKEFSDDGEKCKLTVSNEVTLKTNNVSTTFLGGASSTSYDGKVDNSYSYSYAALTNDRFNGGEKGFYLSESKAEVYGESIRVTFTIKYRYEVKGEVKDNKLTKGTDGKYNSAAFGKVNLSNIDYFVVKNNDTEGSFTNLKKDASGNDQELASKYSASWATEEDRYNKLFIRPIVIGLKSDVSGKGTLNYSEVLSVDNVLGNTNDTSNDFITKTNSVDGESPTGVTRFTNYATFDFNSFIGENAVVYYQACVNNKLYFSAENTKLYVGGSGFAEKVLGGKLAGLTTPGRSNNSSLELYRNKSQVAEIELLAGAAKDETNNNYYREFNLTPYLYQGTLNSYRYIYCIYEAEEYSLEIDYNVAGFAGEIDYLKNYAGISLGSSEENDLTNYINSWIYKNVTSAGFGDYDNAENDKYQPYNFLNNYLRQSLLRTYAEGDTIPENKKIGDVYLNNDGHIELTETYVNAEKTREKSTVIYEEKTTAGRYYYIVIDGKKFYFQFNSNTLFERETTGLIDNDKLPKTFKEYVLGESETNQYFVAFSTTNGLTDILANASYRESWDETNHKATTAVRPSGYDDKFGNLVVTNESVYNHLPVDVSKLTDEVLNNFYYKTGDTELNIRVYEDNGIWYAAYHDFNIHERTNATYDNLHYSYANKNSMDVVENTNYAPSTGDSKSLTETFKFNYSDDVKISTIPSHTHYNFKGFDVYFDTTKVGEINITGNSADGININPYEHFLKPNSTTEIFNHLAGSRSDEYNNEKKTIRLVARWEAMDLELSIVFYTTEADGDNVKYNALFNKLDSDGNVTIEEVNKLTLSSAASSTLYPKLYKLLNNNTTLLNSADGKFIETVDTITCKYDPNSNFNSIFTVLNDKGYSSGNITRDDWDYNFFGWAYNHKDETSEENTFKAIKDSETAIGPYLGETTKLIIYAYYSDLIYDFKMNFNSVGGAAEDPSENPDDPSDINDLLNKTLVTPNYSVKISKNVVEDDNDTLTHDNSPKQIEVKNTFVMGENVRFSFTLDSSDKSYYFKKFVVKDLNLKLGDDYKVYTLVIEYKKLDESGNWGWTYLYYENSTPETITDITEADKNSDGKFKIGGSETYKFSIAADTDAYKNKSTVLIFENLGQPGEKENGLFKGSDGFEIDVYFDSYSMDDEDTKAISGVGTTSLVAVQRLSNSSGEVIERLTDSQTECHFWIDEKDYIITLNKNSASAFYRWDNEGASWPLTNGDAYYQFISQGTKENANPNELIIYFDKENLLVYYLATTSWVEESESKGINETFSITVGGSDVTSTSKGSDFLGSADSCYIKYKNAEAATFCSAAEYYNSVSTSDVVYLYLKKASDGSVTIRYRLMKMDFASTGQRRVKNYNTRILSIEPEQANVHTSTNYFNGLSLSNSTLSAYFELSSYISGLKIGETIFSFDQITKGVSRVDNQYMYGNLVLNLKNVDTGNTYTRLDGEDNHPNLIGKKYSYLDGEYTINDAYKLTVKKIDNSINPIDYYFFVARRADGFTRYFLVYNEGMDTLTNRENCYDFELTFEKIENKMTINLTDNDLYLEEKTLEASVIKEQGWATGNTANEIEYADGSDNDKFNENGDKKYQLNSSFLPTDSLRFCFNTISGYVISAFTISIGKFEYENVLGESVPENLTTRIRFVLDIDGSFEDIQYSGGDYSYLTSSAPHLKYFVKFLDVEGNEITESIESIGYNMGKDNNKRGLLFGNYKTNAWSCYAENSYTFDFIYLLISSLYEDVKIEIETTTYVEFLFENEDGSLLKTSISDTEGKNYKDINIETESNLTLYIQTSDVSGNVDKTILSQTEGEVTNFILRYYPNVSTKAPYKGTLRLIFFGTGSKIAEGLHVLATNEASSTYFTDARYYNKNDLDNENKDAFKSLSAYSGRDNEDNRIKTDKTNLSSNCKLVYFYTGKLVWMEGEGEPRKLYYPNKKADANESNQKFFFAAKAVKNEISVETRSYLYNDVNTSARADQVLSDTVSSNDNGYNYKFIISENDNDEVYIENSGSTSGSYYQLDNTKKSNSWFNDTVLSNIDYVFGENRYPWHEQNNLKDKWMSITTDGLQFSWNYFNIAGYYLEYIMFYLAELDTYFIVDVQNLISKTTSETIKIDGYNFTLNKISSTNYGGFTLTSNISEGMELSDIVSLMSNNIRVAFVSKAYTYTINYYNDEHTSSSQMQENNYYDSMVKLEKVAEQLTGYTFIGWGSRTYFNGSELVPRYTPKNHELDKSKPRLYSSASNWYDPTEYFFGKNLVNFSDTIQTDVSLYDWYNTIFTSTASPSGAFYADGGYFMTDTGYKSGNKKQNYNFLCDYITTFYVMAGGSSSTALGVNLYPIFKANTYAIKFEINNTKGDTAYLNDLKDNTKWINTADSFLPNNLGFKIDVVEVEDNKEKITTYNYYAYVTYDTNDWHFSSSDARKLFYSYYDASYIEKEGEIKKAYTINKMSNEQNKSTLAIDMFGYTWLGWYSNKLNDTNQNNETVEISRGTMIFDSNYSYKKMYGDNTSNKDITVFNSDSFSTIAFDETKKMQKFIYYNQGVWDSSIDPTKPYVYFYDYRGDNTSGDIDYQKVTDYLNSFITKSDNSPIYEQKSDSLALLSYYDTCFSSDVYSCDYDSVSKKYSLSLNRVYTPASGTGGEETANFRIVKLFANWSQNDYHTVYAKLDKDDTFENFGSSATESFVYTSGQYWFNDKNLETDLTGKPTPTRIGYDFVGWSFNYIPVASKHAESYATAINQPSPILYLCKDLFAYYTALDPLKGTVTDMYESNILMIKGSLVNSEAGTDWLLNAKGNAEHLGDEDSISGLNRYIYLFPVWRAQTFSANISLNITGSDLKNLYGKDSSLALALYESYNSNKKPTSFTGISSKYYTYKTSGTGRTSTENYFNDIVANVCFEFEFDQPISSAKLSFGNKTYHLQDLFATSAGYYFLGLMKNLTGSNYVVENTLNSVFKYDTTTLANENNVDGGVTLAEGNFDFEFYESLYRSRQQESGQQASNPESITTKNSAGESSNFGFITLDSKKYNIMSELYGGQYYLFILVKNVKYYVVYYYENANGKDRFSFDRTFLYFNADDGNKYIVRFDFSGKAYYVSNGYSGKIELDSGNIKVALYNSRRNTVILETTGANQTVKSETIFTSISNNTTREFTLYANWEIKTIQSEIYNGNNTGSSNDNNQGLAGWYSIESTGNSKINSNSQTDNSISQSYEFYSNVAYEFLPYYNGRYLSELKLEFDTLSEANQGMSSNFTMTHNTLSLRFGWDNVNKKIAINNIYLNGIAQNLPTTTSATGGSYTQNKFNIDILSILDSVSLGSGSGTSYFHVYAYDQGTTQGRVDINPVTMGLTEVMTSIKFTCKYSVQTFNLKVYNVVGDATYNGTSYELNNNTTNFSTLAEMNLYTTQIYDSSLSASPFTRTSTDCAFNVASYDIPYNYRLAVNSVSGDKLNTTGNYYNDSAIYSGLTNTSGYGLLSGISKPDSYEHVGWYLEPKVEDNKVKFSYSYPNGQENILKNTEIYRYITPTTGETARVLFYYWNGGNGSGQYLQYLNNMTEYTYSTNSNSKITTDGSSYKVKALPSSGMAEWAQGEEESLVGYILITQKDLENLINSSPSNNYKDYLYDSSNVYVGTQGEIQKCTGTSPENITIEDLLSAEFQVIKYFTKKEGNITYLDAARVKFKYNNEEIIKDFKMLNTKNTFGSGKNFAIPIYDKLELEINGCNYDNKNLTITTNDNMITSKVFEYTTQYTVFYNPMDLRIGILNTANASLNNFNDLTTKDTTNSFSGANTTKYWTLQKEDRGDNSYYYRTLQNNLSSGTVYLYVYYVNNGVPFKFSTNYLTITSSGVSGETNKAIDQYSKWPLNVSFDVTNLGYYNSAANTLSSSSYENYNRKLIIRIALQLIQSGKVIINNNQVNYYYGKNSDNIQYSGFGSDNDTVDVYCDIETCISKINSNETIYTNQLGFYRLVYSIAYYFVTEKGLNGKNTTGLAALWGDGTSLNASSINTGLGTGTSVSGIKPGDILKDDRSELTQKYTIWYYDSNDQLQYKQISYVNGYNGNMTKSAMLLYLDSNSTSNKICLLEYSSSGFEIKENSYTFKENENQSWLEKTTITPIETIWCGKDYDTTKQMKKIDKNTKTDEEELTINYSYYDENGVKIDKNYTASYRLEVKNGNISTFYYYISGLDNKGAGAYFKGDDIINALEALKGSTDKNDLKEKLKGKNCYYLLEGGNTPTLYEFSAAFDPNEELKLTGTPVMKCYKYVKDNIYQINGKGALLNINNNALDNNKWIFVTKSVGSGTSTEAIYTRYKSFF